MMRLSATLRISLGLACLTTSVVLTASWLGLVPDARPPVIAGRKALCEAVAIQCCLAAERNDLATIRMVTRSLVGRNEDVISAAVRRVDGRVLVDAGNHEQLAKERPAAAASENFVEVPIFEGKSRWGSVEVRFREIARVPFGQRWFGPGMQMVLFVACAGFLFNNWYLRRVLKHFDPSAVIPDRVRSTLDTLAEGVLVLDNNERVVLANKAFGNFAGRAPEELQGSKPPQAMFSPLTGDSQPGLPWHRALREGVSETGVLVGLDDAREGKRTLAVNSTPILGADGRRRGVLATFDDITSIEQKNVQLQQMLEVLQQSREEIRRQNEELSLLATRDPLTGCVNRRAFFSQFEIRWREALESAGALACIMVDIDHFKSINDQHGHATGDQVLQQIAATLRGNVRESDLVCRYGGEEFCVLLPQANGTQAMEVAEKLRAQIAARPCGGLSVTASLGVSDIESKATEPRDLLEQADKALYASKHGGRNRVTNWRDVPADSQHEPRVSTRKPAAPEVNAEVAIPFHAVTALTSALAYRDTLTAEHSRRVADLCVLTARGLMPARSCYVLEVAALLHDIGKLGVPDAILLKPGPLTEEEWKVMGTHDRIGVEIISAAFSSPELSEIVRTHHAWYQGEARDRALPQGEEIPVGARILTIADAFDAMVSDRVYRKGRRQAEAFEELRRCAGRQFDPELVERFVEAVSASDDSRRHTSLDVSKQTALRIGMQIERLAEALDLQDFSQLSVMAGRLARTAAKEGVNEIAQVAADLEQLAVAEPDLIEVVRRTTELLELCRSTQNSYLAVPDGAELLAGVH